MVIVLSRNIIAGYTAHLPGSKCGKCNSLAPPIRFARQVNKCFRAFLHCSGPMPAKKGPGYSGAFLSKHPISVAGGRRHSTVVSRPIRLDRMGWRRIGVAASKLLARRHAFQPLIVMMPGGGRRLYRQCSDQQSSEDGKNFRSHCYLPLRDSPEKCGLRLPACSM
jgi:hypothetical protein